MSRAPVIIIRTTRKWAKGTGQRYQLLLQPVQMLAASTFGPREGNWYRVKAPTGANYPPLGWFKAKGTRCCCSRYRLQQQLVPLAWTDGPFSSSVTHIYLVGNIATNLARSISLPNFGFQTNQMLKIWQCHNFSWVSFGGQPSRPYIYIYITTFP